jgi:glycosyltransferase involved in cell wall biosynthesis
LAALAFSAETGRRMTERPNRTADDHDTAVDAAASRAFAEQYGGPNLGPVAVVIPAYREAVSIGSVVASIPSEVLGLRVAVLVIVDGPDEATAAAASASGACVCAVPTNRGQGAALRLGYALAYTHGARFIVTIDADGQYDPREIADVLGPIVAGDADFVSGSRRLGENLQGDRVRASGVVLYAALIRLLTGQRVTDPSFGLRAMRSEVPSSLTLSQPQYQAAELLVGAIMNDFRVAERPATMHARTGGASHKGANLVYGWRFGNVIVTTWRRERARARRRTLT